MQGLCKEMKSKAEQMKEAIGEISSKDKVSFDEYREFVRGGLTMDEYRTLGDETVDKLLEHGDVIDFGGIECFKIALGRVLNEGLAESIPKTDIGSDKK